MRDTQSGRTISAYFDWVCGLIDDRHSRLSYNKLLAYLNAQEFHWVISNDANRAKDGINLRWRFACENYCSSLREEICDQLLGACSILEMMVALAIRCEESIMDDPVIGDRTGKWFWIMISNLGLSGMTDDTFDEEYVEDVIIRFTNRDYEPDGNGGLFMIENCPYDLREVEIWYQMCWYLNSVIERRQ